MIFILPILGVLTCLGLFTQAEESCGAFKYVDKIVGGSHAELGEFPWATVLIYKKGQKILPGCGGSLLNERYVLTAAHCINGSMTEKRLGQVIVVRVGEYDISESIDCVTKFNDKICAPRPQDIPIESVHIHPEYNNTLRSYNDIALIKLSTAVDFGTYVKPLCLPTDDVLKKMSEPSTTFTVIGWGKTETKRRSNILLKVEIPQATEGSCGEKHICAGANNRDTCDGDSGGPLMFLNENPSGKKLQWHVVGVTAYGSMECGSEHFPAIYTRIGSYLQWIQSYITL